MVYGIPERAAMIALMALNKETPNAELKTALQTRREEVGPRQAQPGRVSSRAASWEVGVLPTS